MRFLPILVLSLAAAGCAVAQIGDPANPQASTTLSGSIAQFNYGPEGQVEGMVLSPNALVNLPPDWAAQVEATAKTGARVQATGIGRITASGMRVVDAERLEINGKTWTQAVPSQPSPYTGSGVVRALNYGREGEVNGFMLSNGVLARTPPFGESNTSAVKVGATVAVAGFAHQTGTGTTVVEVQSITVNGQTVAMNAMPPAGPVAPVPPPPPGAGPGPRGPVPPPPGGPLAAPPAPPVGAR